MNLKRVFTWIVAPFLVAALLLVAMVSFGQDGRLAYAAKSINVKQSTLANPKCEPNSPNEWHFVINQIDKAANVPASITVSWDNGATEVVPLQKYTGGTAHYSTTSNLGANVTGATTTIYDKWGGQFNLSHGPCVFPLVVSKTAETSYIRTYTWGIEKIVVGPDYAELPVGTDSATFNYQVTVTADGGTDSGFAVSGVITITNPNALIAATITSVTDLVSPDIAASVDCGVALPYVLAGGGVLQCSYGADLPDASARVNTATVTTSGKVPGGTGSADVLFGEPSDILDECVDVNDDLYGALGTVCVDQSPAIFNYALTFTRDNIAACDTPTSFTNTANFLTNDLGAWGSSSATVTVIKFCPIVAQWCSPGFWSQNYPNLVGTPYDITGFLGMAYSDIGGAALKDGAPANPTIGDVLASPNIYGGPAFNSVANFFASVFGWGGTQETGENCPIDAHGNLK